MECGYSYVAPIGRNIIALHKPSDKGGLLGGVSRSEGNIGTRAHRALRELKSLYLLLLHDFFVFLSCVFEVAPVRRERGAPLPPERDPPRAGLSLAHWSFVLPLIPAPTQAP
jgi:hypothetical protein